MQKVRYFFAVILSLTIHLIFIFGGDFNNGKKNKKNKSYKMEVILNKLESERGKKKKILTEKDNRLPINKEVLTIKGDMKESTARINKDNVDNLKTAKIENENSDNYKEPKIYFKKPEYPYMSRVLGEEGKVVLRVKIGKKDNILSVNILESSGYERLDKIVVKNIRNAKVKSAAKNGKKIIAEKKIGPFVFKLEDQD
ncbi:MAG: energy transducer TonB [Candidatus Mcinerneyibacterium aminivorans]|uniref:Energy transducer TonB n=1 Tax=Candidatus Mcinerneyibacterium aminivorans TaxID=2703815 RepID=A0A5D0MF25_9BACT|nr:MAG: energy transducer TonB [Candidatus Mcinerneyibacterium aminivorans]